MRPRRLAEDAECVVLVEVTGAPELYYIESFSIISLAIALSQSDVQKQIDQAPHQLGEKTLTKGWKLWCG